MCLLCVLFVASCNKRSESDNWGDILVRYVVEDYMPAGEYVWNWNEAVFLKAVVARCENNIDSDYLLTYVKAAVDSTFDDANGLHPNAVVSGLGLAYLAQATGDTIYSNKAMEVYNQYLNIPRADNGGVSHREEVIELWDDTVYMVDEFLMQMYKLTGNYEYLREAISQYKKHAEKLEDTATGLWYHGWDNDTIPSQDPCCAPGWAENPDRRNTEFWGRGNGWIVMTLADLLELLPGDDENYEFLKNAFVKKMETLLPLQDDKSGHWYQLPVYPGEEGNFLESSATAMFAYSAAKGVALGILDDSRFMPAVDKAYNGLRDKSICISEDRICMDNICTGTCIGDKEYYYGREIVDARAYAFGIAIMFYDQYNSLKNKGK